MRRSIRTGLGYFALCVILVAGRTVEADVMLPDANYSYAAMIGGATVAHDGDHTPLNLSVNLNGATWSVAQSGTPDPTATMISSNCLTSCSGNSTIIYDIEVVGPASESAVPVDIVAVGNITSSGDPTAQTGNGNATAVLETDTAQDHFATGGFLSDTSLSCISNGFLTGPGLACGDIVQETLLAATPNTPYAILIGATTTVDQDGVASATIDPSIYIDPTFADANQYSIVLSTGIGNPPPSIPEPSTLVLLGAALAALGSLRRPKKAVV